MTMPEGVAGTPVISDPPSVDADDGEIMQVSSEKASVKVADPVVTIQGSSEGTIVDRGSGMANSSWPPPYKHGCYTDSERKHAQMLGLRLLTEHELRLHPEKIVERLIDGEVCECFRMAAGEHLVLTRQMYETLWSSKLLPAGARSAKRVFTGRSGFVLLMKGRGMPYPVAW
ncbi:MAG: hypothetical protein GY934_01890, partial [Gammaproteobacteria bacterium]|nr:hypothetical protein [Gammaproteobacteria bacterium]